MIDAKNTNQMKDIQIVPNHFLEKQKLTIIFLSGSPSIIFLIPSCLSLPVSIQYHSTSI